MQTHEKKHESPLEMILHAMMESISYRFRDAAFHPRKPPPSTKNVVFFFFFF
jgi:hypothetical protein